MRKNVVIFLCFVIVLGITIIGILKEPEKTASSEQKRVSIKTEKNENIVFLGDSITEWYPYEFYYKNSIPFVNSGKSGYKSATILENLVNMVYIYNPTKVVLLIGTNDMNTSNYDRKETLKNIEMILDNIQKNRPYAKIYIQSIYPINRTDHSKVVLSTVGIRENQEIQEVNQEIKKIAKKKKIEYIDMYQELADENGNFNIYYTQDGLHLNELGYYIVTQKLTSIIEK